MKQFILTLALLAVLLVGCAAPDLNAPIPSFETGIDPNAWAQVPAGEFLFGQHKTVETTAAFEMMVTDVTVSQYADYLTAALAAGEVKIGEFNGKKQSSGFIPATSFTASNTRKKSKPVTGFLFHWVTQPPVLFGLGLRPRPTSSLRPSLATKTTR